MRFASYFEMLCNILGDPICISTPIGESVIVTHVYRAFPIFCMGFQNFVDLVILDISDFDMILGLT